MKYRQMGRWGVKLSCVGLGSYLTIGFKCTEEESRDTIRAAYDNGVNFFDTANAYNRGEAEKVLGKYLGEFERSSVFPSPRSGRRWATGRTPAASPPSTSSSSAMPRSGG